jgi:exodeoxyribonuclease-5
MDFSQQQQTGLDATKVWHDSLSRGDDLAQIFRFFGYAGTGKTTIAQEFATLVDGPVHFATYTGKAAHVLREKGCRNAGTLHSLIYQPKSRSAARLRELQREYIEIEDATPDHVDELDAIKRSILAEQENVKRPSFGIKEGSDLEGSALLVVDEVSMVDEQMGEDLLSFGVPILALGDPAQLPPVKGGGFFTEAKADVLLTDIHRQAAGSPILALATAIREGRGFADTDLVRPVGQSLEFMAGFDQILCGLNKTRRVVNKKMRAHLGFTSALPMPGDRLICTRNDGDTGLLNGSQWIVQDSHWDGNSEELAIFITAADSDEQLRVVCHHEYFLGEEPPYFMVRKKQCFDFAYAMTVHKSQGSQFDSVCLIDEAMKFPNATKSFKQAWRYTGITRAAKELTIIR